MSKRQRPETITIGGKTYPLDYDTMPYGWKPLTKDSGLFKIIALDKQFEDETMMDIPTLSGWDYRVVKLQSGQYAIHEVYFDDQEQIEFTARALPEGHDLAELAHDLAAMVEALGKPVLDEAAIEAATEKVRKEGVLDGTNESN